VIPDLANAHVLLVEDNDDDALLFSYCCRQINNSHWRIDHSRTYDEARSMIESKSYDLYFIDYRLGPHTGIEVIHELQKLGRSAPIILMTGIEDERIGDEGLVAGATEVLSKQDLNSAAIARTARHGAIRRRAEGALRVRANEDGMTHTFNRAHFLALAEIEMARSQRFGHSLAMLMIDIDHFKHINDSQGHAAGDRVIQAVADRCRQTLRASDLLGRYGGDEFIALLPQTDLAGAGVLAERVRSDMRHLRATWGTLTTLATVSVGVACAKATDLARLPDLIEAADEALYRAKHQGRDRVELAS